MEETYDLEPVYYCADCCSLRVESLEDDDSSLFCSECGSMHIL